MAKLISAWGVHALGGEPIDCVKDESDAWETLLKDKGISFLKEPNPNVYFLHSSHDAHTQLKEDERSEELIIPPLQRTLSLTKISVIMNNIKNARHHGEITEKTQSWCVYYYAGNVKQKDYIHYEDDVYYHIARSIYDCGKNVVTVTNVYEL